VRQGVPFARRAEVGARAAALALAALLLACAPAEPPGPGLVVVTLDTLRADHLGSYGYFRDTAPHLDRLARESLLFENAWATAASTLASHVALFTGRHANRTGVHRNRHNFVPRAGRPPRLLAQWLRDAGWRTGAFVSAPPVAPDTGLPHGFDTYDGPRFKRDAFTTTERALAWLDGVEGPYFLWLHYFEPHGDYDPPERFRRFRADAELRAFLAARAFADPADPDVLERHDLYDGEIAAADAALAGLVEGLRGRGGWDALTLVVTADHGEGLLEHGVPTHPEVWREQLHVPLLIKLPRALGVAPGRRPELASLVDVVPTLVGALDLPAPPEAVAELEGVDLLREARDHAYSQVGLEDLSLVTPDWRLARRGGRTRLYDRRRDPNERHDVAARHPEVVARLLARAEAVAGEPAPPDATLFEIHDEREEKRRAQLRALGYVVDD